ncbi:UNVERIFIED_CONTAM: hypothetical protein FKN15_008192 [Acipenser sinensis]
MSPSYFGPGNAEQATPGDVVLATLGNGEQTSPGDGEQTFPGYAELTCPGNDEEQTAKWHPQAMVIRHPQAMASRRPRIDVTEGRSTPWRQGWDLDAKYWQGVSWTFVDKLRCLHYGEDHFGEDCLLSFEERDTLWPLKVN